MKTEYWKKNQNFFWIFYRKCSTFRYFRYFGNTENISNTVQYYWILKMFNTEISILLNIENVQYWIFNTIEYRKKFQSRTPIIPKIIFNISPHPTVRTTKAVEGAPGGVLRLCSAGWLSLSRQCFTDVTSGVGAKGPSCFSCCCCFESQYLKFPCKFDICKVEKI